MSQTKAVKETRELLKAADFGVGRDKSWAERRWSSDGKFDTKVRDDHDNLVCEVFGDQTRFATAELISAAPRLLVALVAEIKALRAELRALKDKIWADEVMKGKR